MTIIRLGALAAIAAVATTTRAQSRGTELLHPDPTSHLAFERVTITAAKDNGGRPFSLATTATDLLSTHTSLKDLIRFAYHAKSYDQIIGGPQWSTTESYDVDAKWGDSTFKVVNAMSDEQSDAAVRRMVQRLLADRFQLKAHIETRNVPVYALVIASGGPKLKAAAAKGELANPSLVFTSPTQVRATAQTTRALTDFLSIFAELGGRVIVDQTGLTGNYDFVINGISPKPSKDPAVTPLNTALREQLGLALEQRQATGVEVVVIDHAERPTLN
jgi:uncharacterized protein (TIGR03435 family)